MSRWRGLCLISIPKSGTMFLSRYLERVTGTSVVFGLEPRSAQQLALELTSGWHPAIQAATVSQQDSTRLMCQRYAQMLARHRPSAQEAQDEPQPSLLSDHGYTNFLQFLINPSMGQVCDPHALIRWASERQLATVFLHRSLPEVANSLALFLASGKSFLLSLRSIREAAALVTELHAPVLAAQTALWLDIAPRYQVPVLSYDALIADPARWIRTLAQLGNLNVQEALLQDDASAYRSWTYRQRQGQSSA